jgi:hypothetical protein
MIKNKEQYQKAEEWVKTFEQVANDFGDDDLGKMLKDAYEDDVEKLKKEMKAYKKHNI